MVFEQLLRAEVPGSRAHCQMLLRGVFSFTKVLLIFLFVCHFLLSLDKHVWLTSCKKLKVSTTVLYLFISFLSGLFMLTKNRAVPTDLFWIPIIPLTNPHVHIQPPWVGADFRLQWLRAPKGSCLNYIHLNGLCPRWNLLSTSVRRCDHSINTLNRLTDVVSDVIVSCSTSLFSVLVHLCV